MPKTNTIKTHIGLRTLLQDKEIIEKASEIQRRSVASFVLESALIRARKIVQEEENGIPAT